MRGPRRSSRRWRGDGPDFPPAAGCPVTCSQSRAMAAPPYRSGAGPGPAGPGAGGRRRGSPEAWRGDAEQQGVRQPPAPPGWLRSRPGRAEAGCRVQACPGGYVGPGEVCGPMRERWPAQRRSAPRRRRGPAWGRAWVLSASPARVRRRISARRRAAGRGRRRCRGRGSGRPGAGRRRPGARLARRRGPARRRSAAGVPGDDQRVDRPSAVQAEADELVQGAVGPCGERRRGQPRGDVAAVWRGGASGRRAPAPAGRPA